MGKYLEMGPNETFLLILSSFLFRKWVSRHIKCHLLDYKGERAVFILILYLHSQ